MSKGSEAFKAQIKKYLDNRSEEDLLFYNKYTNPKKNIDDCITYILNTVKNSGCNGFADDEIYSMAVHYYDEENIVVGSPIQGQVVVNHHIELTQEEIDKAKQDAIDKVHNETIQSMKRIKPSAKPKQENSMLNLFGDETED